jgi:predicted nucleic acid-binding protein
MARGDTGKLVLDASAVVRIIEGSPQAAAMGEALAAADLVLAPELMLTEVANALWRLQRAGQLEGAGLQQRFERAVALIDHIEPDRTLQAEALALATHLDHPVYDCLYLGPPEKAATTAGQQRWLIASL